MGIASARAEELVRLDHSCPLAWLRPQIPTTPPHCGAHVSKPAKTAPARAALAFPSAEVRRAAPDNEWRPDRSQATASWPLRLRQTCLLSGVDLLMLQEHRERLAQFQSPSEVM